jgi:hypothetical protein
MSIKFRGQKFGEICCITLLYQNSSLKQEGHDGPEIAHLNKTFYEQE